MRPKGLPSSRARPASTSRVTRHVVLKGYVEPKVIAPGEKVRLVITAEPTEGWHIYALAAAIRKKSRSRR